jgi:streptogramin lyase
MSLSSALREAIRPRTRANQRNRRAPNSTPRRQRLAVEILEDRLCLSGDLLVASFFSNSVLAYDGTQGTFLQPFTSGGNLESPVGVALDANGDVYVGGRDSNNVLHYDGNTGALVGSFVAPGSGGLDGPHGITFGPDGNLYVNSGFNGSVLRYNGSTGAFLNTFVTSGSGGLVFPHGLTFGPDGDLYVADRNTDSVLRYDGTTGAFLGDFVSAGSGGLDIATGLVFGPDGNLYVDSFNTNSVLRYDGTTGAFLGTFASGGGLSGPQGLAFGPDGNLYVSSFNTSSVLRYNGTTGAFMDVFASGGGLDGPTYLVFRPTHSTTSLVPSANPLVFGQPVTFTATVSSVTATGGVPTGTVTFTIDGAAQAPVTLSNGQATLTISTLSVGSQDIIATYNADPGFQGSTSAEVQEMVNRADTTTTVTDATNPSVFGHPVAFTAAVAAVTPGAGTPTGTITFVIDGVARATVPLADGTATFTTWKLAPGTHQITVLYNGDGNFAASESPALEQAIERHHHHQRRHHHHRYDAKRDDRDHDRDCAGRALTR